MAGNQCYVDEEFEAAIEHYSEALKSERSPQVLVNRAAAFLKLEKFDGKCFGILHPSPDCDGSNL